MKKQILYLCLAAVTAALNSCTKENNTTKTPATPIVKGKQLNIVPVESLELPQPSTTNPIISLAFDAAGTTYGVRNPQTTYSKSIFKYSNGVLSTFYSVPAKNIASNGDYDAYDLTSRVVVDSKGNIYAGLTNVWSNSTFAGFPQYRSSVILKITPDGTVSTFAGGDSGYQDGNSTSAKFYDIVDLAIDNNDNIIVADASYNLTTNSVRKVTPAGDVTTVIKLGGNLAASVATDKLGNIYVGYTLLSGNIYANTEVDKINASGVSKGLFFLLSTYERNYGPLITDKNNNLWLSSAYFQDETGGINVYGLDGTLLGYKHFLNAFHSIAFDPLGRIYLAGQSSISQWKLQ